MITTQEIQTYIEKIIQTLAVEYNDISIDISSSGSYIFNIQVDDSKFLIGRDGEVLQALNFIVRRYVDNQKSEEQGKIHVTVDVNGYQEEKNKRIKTIAHMMAERSRFFKSSVELDPMNSFERHIIHEYVQELDGLETESVGLGKDRHVVIKYKK